MATMARGLWDRLIAAFGYTHAVEFETLLDSGIPTEMSVDLQQKIRFWLADEVFAVELTAILEGGNTLCSQGLKEHLWSALGDQECGTDIVTLLDAMLGGVNSPSATPSRTPSTSVSRTPSATVSATVSSTPSATVSRTPSNTPSRTPSSTPSGV